MMKSCQRRLGVLAIVFALTGCDGSKLISLNNEFENLYFAKVAGTDIGDNLNVASADFGLAKLSEESKAAGDEAAEKDWRTAVAFYRIAALSAWQAGKRGSAQLFPITDKGQKLCENRIPEAPRDCTLMYLVPPLAVHDELAAGLAPIGEKVSNNQNLDSGELERLKSAFDGIHTQFDKVSDLRSLTGSTGAPPSLLSYVDRQRFLMFCTAKAAHDHMFSARSVGGLAAMQERGDSLAAMKDTVKKSHDVDSCQ